MTAAVTLGAAAGAGGLTAGGVVFLLLGWGGILAGTVYCLVRLFRTRDGK